MSTGPVPTTTPSQMLLFIFLMKYCWGIAQIPNLTWVFYVFMELLFFKNRIRGNIAKGAVKETERQ